MKKNLMLFVSLGFLLVGCVGTDEYGAAGHFIRVAQKARNSNNPDAALSFYNKAKKTDSTNPVIYTGLAEVYIDKKLLDAALESLKTAESLGGEAERIGYLRGKIYLLMGDTDLAVKEFEKFDNSPDCLNALGAVCDNKVGDHERAQNYYKRVIAIDPNYIDAYNNLGLSYMLQNKFNEAIFYLENACSFPEANIHYRSNLALAYGLSGNMSKAREVYSRDYEDEALEERVAKLEDVIANRLRQ